MNIRGRNVKIHGKLKNIIIQTWNIVYLKRMYSWNETQVYGIYLLTQKFQRASAKFVYQKQ